MTPHPQAVQDRINALGSTLSLAREGGVVNTKPWRVELVLDLAGTLPEKRLADLVALEPSVGEAGDTSHCRFQVSRIGFRNEGA